MNKDFNFKKKYGQNFLNDNNILNNIVNSVEITKDDLVIEIGPGEGALTKKIIEKTNKLICFEIDKDLDKYLSKFKEFGVQIVYGDFLEQNINEYIKNIEYDNLYIIANLPYYITTPIITKIIEDKIPCKNCIFMVQKEVADRLSANISTKDYNSLTIFLNYYFKIKKLFDVSRNCFYPKPNVDSSVISLERLSNPPVIVNDEEKFFKLIKDSFKYKRKNLKNNLKDYNLTKVNEVLNKNNMDLTIRAEALSMEIFAQISNNLE